MEKTKEILFRSSGIGALATDKRGAVITDKQLEQIDYLNGKVRSGKSLTQNQKDELAILKAKRDAPIEMSDTAKTFVEDVWLLNEKGYYRQLDTKYTDKGIFGEEDAISLLTEVDGIFYKKNTERIIKNHISGECDINTIIEKIKTVEDTKCSWDPRTFMNATLDPLYEYQGRSYMYLYDAEQFWLRYCLIDAPAHIVAKEKDRLWYKFYSNSMDDKTAQQLEEKLKPMFDQIDRNLVFSTSGKYTPQERVKTFKVERDDQLFKEKILDRIPAAIDYYKTITLNQIC